jgi:hypothetical protein
VEDYPRRAERRVNESFLGGAVAIVLLLPFVLRIAQAWICRIGSQKLWDYGPGQFAWAVSQLANGGSLYRDFRKPPYVPIIYNPLSFYAAALLSRIFGPGPMSALEAGRLQTIAATAAICLLIFLLSRRCGVSRGSALIAAMAFSLSPLLEPWGFAFRSDLPALALDVAGVWFFSLGWVPWSIVMFVAAFFTKQSEIAGIAAVILFSWMRGKRRTAIASALIWTGAVAFGILLFHLLLPYYLLNAFLGLAGLYDFGAPAAFFVHTLRGDLVIAILAGTLLVERRSTAWSLPTFFLLTALAQGLATSVRWGSDVTYFVPAVAAASVLAAQEIDALFRWAGQLSKLAEIWIGAVLALGIVAPLHAGTLGLKELARSDLGCGCFQSGPEWDPKAFKLLNTIHGDVLTDVPGLLLVQEKFKVSFIELGVLKGMRAAGLFDDRPLLDAIHRRTVPAIALGSGLLTDRYHNHSFMWPELREAIADNYHLVPATGPPYVMLPNQ